jgi:hypothetical protein
MLAAHPRYRSAKDTDLMTMERNRNYWHWVLGLWALGGIAAAYYFGNLALTQDPRLGGNTAAAIVFGVIVGIAWFVAVPVALKRRKKYKGRLFRHPGEPWRFQR